MINNFVKNVCECAGDWKMDAFVEETIQSIREKVGGGKVLLALSGIPLKTGLQRSENGCMI